jgi:hypothetical protein
LRERDHWGDPDVDGRIILRRISRKWYMVVWTGLSWLRAVAYPGILFGGVGVQQIQLRTEGRVNGDMGAVVPQSGFHSNCK